MSLHCLGQFGFDAAVSGPTGVVRKQLEEWLRSRNAKIGGPQPSVAFLIQDESDFTGEVVKGIEQFRRHHPETAVAVVVCHPCEELAVSAFRAGVADYLTWPASEAELSAVLARLAKPLCGKVSADSTCWGCGMVRLRSSRWELEDRSWLRLRAQRSLTSAARTSRYSCHPAVRPFRTRWRCMHPIMTRRDLERHHDRIG